MKRMIFLAALFALFSATSALCGEQIRIGYSCCDFEDNFQSRVLNAARERAAGEGVKLIAMDAREKVDLQLQQVDKMIADGVDALVVVPVDTGTVDELVAAARKAKVPLVFVNRNPYVGERPPDNCFVIATDATVEGETQMNYAGPKIGSSGHVVILQGILNNEATQSRTAGVKDVITQSYPELAITAEATRRKS